MKITEQARDIPVWDSYDVVVGGGGIAGISAALAAARNGAKTLLIENQFALGGLATLGLVTIYLPLCDGEGRQMSFGIAEELLRLSVSTGYESGYPKAWLEGGSLEERTKKRFDVRYPGNVFAILCEKLLLETGVTILYGTKICSATVTGKNIQALILENKSGRGAVLGKSFVDCTGDADICHFAGAPTAIFQQGNVLASWYYYHHGQKVDLRILGFCDVPDKYKTKKEEGKRYVGLDGAELSQMVCDSHKTLWEDFSKGGNTLPDHNLTQIASIPQVRMTRRLEGAYVMDDVETDVDFPDGVGLFADWRKRGARYSLPYRTLYCSQIENLFVAGRCISTTDAMWDVTRVIPVCAVSGEAAGTAAALSQNGRIDAETLRKVLQSQGVVTDFSKLPQ